MNQMLFCCSSSSSDEPVESLDNIEKKMAEIMGEGAEEERAVEGGASTAAASKSEVVAAKGRDQQHWQLQQSKPKTREEIEAAKILKTDKATKELYGFDEEDIAAAANRSAKLSVFCHKILDPKMLNSKF